MANLIKTATLYFGNDSSDIFTKNFSENDEVSHYNANKPSSKETAGFAGYVDYAYTFHNLSSLLITGLDYADFA